MPRPERLSLEGFLAADWGRAHLYALPRFRAMASERLGLPLLDQLEQLPADAESLVVLGGGALIDGAKLWRRHQRPELRLIAIPSIWGSGAEASRVVALNREGAKFIEVDDELLPHARVVWPELAQELPAWRAKHACGDAWSHALEGFLSPLASDPLRAELAAIAGQMLALPLSKDPAWFDPSALASAAQGKCSVGLVHGIAHTLEGPLMALEDSQGFGHARLCSIFLKPVMALNQSSSPKFDNYTLEHGLAGAEILAVLDELHEPEAYAKCLPLLESHWRSILRDPCSRTNSALVRPAHLGHFLEGDF